MGFHYGLAISWAPLYALLRRWRLHPIPAGLTMGTAMSLIADETMTPALGSSAPNRAYPLATHLRGVAAHLRGFATHPAFGLAVAAVTETAWALRGRRPLTPGVRSGLFPLEKERHDRAVRRDRHRHGPRR